MTPAQQAKVLILSDVAGRPPDYIDNADDGGDIRLVWGDVVIGLWGNDPLDGDGNLYHPCVADGGPK